ncbi:hypothetical protein [Streptomyces solaniscabiei]|uniref:hypothetical protein n=1 Tax=Streptomyces solaniscabiei TaxID=2683255 RepID=UPI0027DFC4CB|nr:hypothetical protein [Streptomyces solaniscabiei]
MSRSLREHDEDAKSQRWRFVTAEPERTSDPVLRWASLSHWNGRQSWRLTRSPKVRERPGRRRVEERRSQPSPDGRTAWWAGLGARFLADTTEQEGRTSSASSRRRAR